MAMTAAILTTTRHQAVPLVGMKVSGEVRDALARVSIDQTYVNREESNIEAVYTFPLPVDAVLLELTVFIGDRVLRGTVVEKKEAEAAYEEAIDQGHGAFMLERAGEGLYTMNVGNILAGEQARIRLRYGQLLCWQGETMRMFLPTTIAPRYGDPASHGFLPHQEVPHCLDSGLEFSIAVDVLGGLSLGSVACPSHTVVLEKRPDGVRVSTKAKGVAMDRDFVLVFRQTGEKPDSALTVLDTSGCTVLATFHPVMAGKKEPPVRIKILLDCSGSMSGDSISQARQGLLKIVDNLRQGDAFSLTTFGSGFRHLFPSLVPATDRNLAKARSLVATLEADQGGTELARAIHAVLDLDADGHGRSDILVITDGEVWMDDSLNQRVRASGQRVFTVGVGSAVAEGVVQGLAGISGGACEMVSPNESMAESILRQFKRMRSSCIGSARVVWPGTPVWQSPSSVGNIFPGDTVHVFGRFDRPVTGTAELWMDLPDGSLVRRVALPQHPAPGTSGEPDDLSRMGADRRVREMLASDAPVSETLAMALEHQLVTPLTNLVAILERPEGQRAEDIPQVRRVAHTLAAGWGGMGRVASPAPDASVCLSYSEHVYHRHVRPSAMMDADMGPGVSEFFSMKYTASLEFVADRLGRLLKGMENERLGALSIDVLQAFGVPGEYVEAMRDMVARGHEEADVVAAFLVWLVGQPEAKAMDKTVVRRIRKLKSGVVFVP